MADIGEWAEREWARWCETANAENSSSHDAFLMGYAAAVESMDKIMAEVRRRLRVA